MCTLRLLVLFTLVSLHIVAGESAPSPGAASVVVRRAPSLNSGQVQGSVRVLQGENITLNGGSSVTQFLFVPGTPKVRLNQNPSFGGTIAGSGSETPAGYFVTLNGNAALGKLVTRINPSRLQGVNAPPVPAGTRNVTLNQPGQSPGDFATLRNLTLNGSAGVQSIPPGTYGQFTANGSTGFILGNAGDTQPAVYNFDKLTLNGESHLQVVGPVVVTLAQGTTLNGSTAGAQASPHWLTLRLASGNLTLNGGSSLYATVQVPNGRVTVNGNTLLRGLVESDQLTLNGGIIEGTASGSANTAPTVNAGADISINFPANANLAGTASDDGQPAALTTAWSKVSGPGSVTFANASALATTASFSEAGVYVLRLTADDSALNTSDDFSVFVNAAPTVSAGTAQTIQLPNPANLAAQASDDGLPNPPAALTYQWSKVSGPGTVTFTAATSLTTQASFSQAGDYVLRITVSDSALDAQSDVAVIVQLANAAPLVSAGPDQNINFPNAATLAGTATDDGIPAPLVTSWSKVSGPGSVLFADASALNTTATFSQVGVYVLRLTANDSALSTSDDVSIFVNATPTASAGPAQTIRLPDAAALTGQANDDGLPNPPAALTYQWSKVSGPGTVTFTAATALATQAFFSVSGEYVLRLVASDSALTAQSDIQITVQPANTAPTVNAGADQSINFPQAAVLTGTATDDGIPAALMTTWSKSSGPGTVTFANARALSTTATFSQAGIYVLRLTADDSALDTSDEMTVFVNAAPTANAGQPQTITLPNAVSLAGQATDDGLPNPPAALTFQWTKLSGTGDAVFTAPTALATQASFSSAGNYVLRLTVSDSALSAQSDVAITVQEDGGVPSLSPQITSPREVVDVSAPDIAWTAVNGATVYELRIEDADTGTIVVSETGLTTLSYQVGTPLEDGRFYNVRVRAGNEAGFGPWSLVQQFRVQLPVAGPPVFLIEPKWTNYPIPVNSVGTILSTLGSDTSGEASLTYSWQFAGIDPNRTVSFAPNGNNAAKNCNVTFSAPGNYDLEVTITDPDGETAISTVTVEVASAIKTLAIDPQTANVPARGTKQFLLNGTNQFDEEIALMGYNVSWTATGGTIDSVGLYTAQAAAGGPFSVSATTQASDSANGQPVSANASVFIANVSQSPLQRSEPFDTNQFLNDEVYRTRYLAAVEPSRVWQTALGAAGIPQIKSPNSRWIDVASRGLTTIQAIAAPNAPVSFTCLGEGRFTSNSKNAITVQADAAGTVQVEFQAPQSGKTNVLAGSPFSSGTLRIIVKVQE